MPQNAGSQRNQNEKRALSTHSFDRRLTIIANRPIWSDSSLSNKIYLLAGSGTWLGYLQDYSDNWEQGEGELFEDQCMT